MKQKRFLRILLCLALTLALALPALAAPYIDVPETAWYAEAADYCARAGLMQGVGGGRFEPSAKVTRGMAVTVLHRIAGKPAPAVQGAFTDIDAGDWYAEAADWAAETGISGGVGGGRFAPKEPVLRQDLAVFFWRLAGSPAAAEPSGFSDESAVSAYALDAVRWASAAGILNGMGDGSFAPRGSATRAQLAAILMRLDRSDLLGLDRVDTVDALYAPSGIVMEEDGALLVADTYYKRIWRIRDGVITSFAGADTPAGDLGMPAGGYRDSRQLRSLFLEPWAITPFLDGWAVSDAANNALRYISGNHVVTINGAPGEEGLETSDMGVVYDRPTGLATDDEGCLYVADTGSGTIRRITKEGLVTVYAKGLSEPTGLCWYGGSLYVAETGENRILRITQGSVKVLAGSGEEGFDDGAAASASFRSPIGLTAGEDGTIYVADLVNGAVRSISGGQVKTVLAPAGNAEDPVSPMGLLVRDGTLYVTDHYTGALFVLPLN